MRNQLKSVIAAILIAQGAGMAYAQGSSETIAPEPQGSDKEAKTRVLERVVVTANKREEIANEVGASITTLGEEELQDKQFSSPADLARIVPGFSYTDSDVNVPVYSLRGIGFNETSVAASPTVSVYVDEVSLPYPIMTKGAAMDLQRVEVLKGPQGTLYGRNTTGGAINYIANKPTEDFEAGYSLGYGNFDAITADMYVSGPLADNIRSRFSARMNRADGWQKSQTRPGDALGAVDQIAARWLLDWDVNSDVQVELSLSGWSDQGETLAPQLYQIAPTSPANVLPVVLNAPVASEGSIEAADWDPDVDFSRDDNFGQAALRVDWALGEGIDLTSITSGAVLASKAENERDGMASNNSRYQSNSSVRSFSQELRLAGEFGGLANWVAGVNYSKDATEDRNLIFVDTLSQVQASGLKEVGNYGDTDIESSGIFGSVDWALSETLTLVTGARYSEVSQDFTGCSFDTGDGITAGFFTGLSATLRNAVLGLPPLPAGSFVPGGCYSLGDQFDAPVVQDNLNEDNISWRAGLEYQPNEDMLFFASASQGYKSGNFPTVSASSVKQYAAAVQEGVLSYEAGVKASLLDRSMQANFAAFYYDYEDKQVRGRIQDPVFSTLQRLVNIPKSHATGAELDVTWLATEGLTLNGSATYIDTVIDEYSGYDQFGVITDFEGQPFSYSPKFSYNLGVNYERPVGTGELIAFIGGDYAYRSKTTGDFDIDSVFDIDSYGVLGIRAGIKAGDRWKVMVWGENVTDEYYWTNALRAATDGVVRYVGKPATYGIRLSYAFE